MFKLEINYIDGRIDSIIFETKEEIELHVDLNADTFEDDIWVGAWIEDLENFVFCDWDDRFDFGW